MDTLDWIESMALPHAARCALVRSWRDHEPAPPAVLAQWDQPNERASRRRWAREQWDRCRAAGWTLLVPTDAGYPHACLALHDPPPVLCVKGDASVLDASSSVGIVGARRGTPRGRLTAEAMGLVLAKANLTVVSGLARGVDAAAHRGSLAGGGRTVGVLGTSLDRVYPADHQDLHENVARAGCLVSELLPGMPTRRHHFLARNRILAALGRALVVVEAGERSGALSTVDFATQVGAEVMAVPGPVDCPHAVGTLNLLRQGAVLVRHGNDVLESLGLDPVPAEVEPVLGVEASPATAEEIARRLNWRIDRVLSYLTEQEAEGRVRRLPGGRYALAPGQSSLADRTAPPLT